MTTIPLTVPGTNWKPALILTGVLAVIAFLAAPLGPLGVFWRPSADIDMSSVSTFQISLFILLNIIEALAFGLGVAFLVFGYPYVRAVTPASLRLTRAAHFSIAWLLINWWLHNGMHTHNGMDLGGLLKIDYAFHVTLIIAGLIVASFFLTIIGQREVVDRVNLK